MAYGLTVLREHLGLQDASQLPADVRWKYQDNEWTRAIRNCYTCHLGKDVVQTLKLQIGDTLQLRPGAHSLEVVMSVQRNFVRLCDINTVPAGHPC